MYTLHRVALIVVATALMTACSQSAIPSAQTVSPRICEVQDINQIRTECNPGETLAFLPRRWGSEQYPMIVVAVACDLRQQVVHSKGGVICTVKTPVPEEPSDDDTPNADEA